jgi:chaperonin GroEL (HSP60 family)
LKKDQEKGLAPTIENVHEFYGCAELVVSDSKKTKFINPKHMYTVDENGEFHEDPIYTSMVNFLETEIENTKSTDSAGEIGLLKKRLSALKANMVEYLVGGVTIAERDASKDLIEDAVKNCKSSAEYGVGRAANFEGLVASYAYLGKLLLDDDCEQINKDIAKSICYAYEDITEILYSTVSSSADEVIDAFLKSLNNNYPFDISNGEITDRGDIVKCSIMLDINILDTISKIITIMVTCNQCLLQAPQLNNY